MQGCHQRVGGALQRCQRGPLWPAGRGRAEAGSGALRLSPDGGSGAAVVHQRPGG